MKGTGVICETRALAGAVIPVGARHGVPLPVGNVLSAHWIPAFAGMTSVSKWSPFQMIPVPNEGLMFSMNH
jgi:hypothetical protein